MKAVFPAIAIALIAATITAVLPVQAGAPGGPGAPAASAPSTGPATGPGARGGRGGRGGFGQQQWPITLPANTDPEWPVADGAQPVRLGTDFKFTEGATCDKDGDIYFVDQNSNRIHKFTFDKSPANKDPLKGEVSIFMDPANYSNGMCFDNDGFLISCADEKNELWKINVADKSHTLILGEVGGKPLNGPNDVWVVPTGPNKGGMYFTDPLFSRTWWGSRPGGTGQQQPGRYVYFLKPDLKTLVPVITDYTQPNGIIGTPDGKTLYVADMNGNATYKFTIKDDGTLADKKLFFQAGSDGMTIDSAGNVYTTSGGAQAGVQIWNKDGKRLGNIPIGSANICFGGKDRNVLFINSSTFVTGLLMKTKGVGPQ